MSYYLITSVFKWKKQKLNMEKVTVSEVKMSNLITVTT